MGASGLAGVVKRAEAHLAAEHDEPPDSVPWDFRHPLSERGRRPTILPGILGLPRFPTKKVGV